MESYKLMTRNHKDVLDELLERVEKALSGDDVQERIEKEKEKLKDMSSKLNNLLDMHLEGKIDYDTYDKKKSDLQKRIDDLKSVIADLQDVGNTKLNIEDRIAFMR